MRIVHVAHIFNMSIISVKTGHLKVKCFPKACAIHNNHLHSSK